MIPSYYDEQLLKPAVSQRLLFLPLFLFHFLLLASLGQAASLNYGPPYISTGDFKHPYGLAIDETQGRLLVADTANRRWKWLNLNAITSGAAAYHEVGFVPASDPAALADPQALAADTTGNIYVVDALKGEVKLYSPSGGGSSGSGSGGGTSGNPVFIRTLPRIVNQIEFLMPRDIAVNAA